MLAGVAELRALLGELGERGGASNAEAMRAMSYGTDARSALDRYLSYRHHWDNHRRLDPSPYHDPQDR